MIGRLLRWTGGTLFAITLVVVVGVAWLIATESGARWLLAQASPRLPAALSIESVDGTFLKGLQFRNTAWQDPSATASVAELATHVELLPLLKREIRITQLALQSVVVTVSERAESAEASDPFSVDIPVKLQLENGSIESLRIATPDGEFLVDRILLAGELSGSSLDVRRFDLQSSLADIALSADVQLTGSYRVHASAGWELRPQNQAPLSGILDVRGDASRYEIQHDLDAPYAVATQGSVAITDSGINLDLDNQWQRLRIEQGGLAAIDVSSGTLHLVGTPDQLVFDGVTSLSSADLPVTAVRAQGVYVGDGVNLESLHVSNDWGQMLADGVLGLTSGPSWSFNLALTELNPAFADTRLRGELEVIGSTSGLLVDGKPELTVAIERISGELNDHRVSGSTVLAYANDRLRFDDAVLGVGDNRVDFDGAYGPHLQVDGRVQLANLGQLGLGIEGAVNGDFRIKSELDRFAASGYISGTNLAWNNYAIERLETRFDLPAARQGTASLEIDSANHGNVTAGIEGRFVDDRWLGNLLDLSVRREPVGEWTLQEAAGFSLSRGELELEKACLATASHQGTACVAVNYDFAGPIQFEATVSDLPVATLPRYLPEGARILGDLNFSAGGDYSDNRLNATTKLGIDGLGLVASYEGEDVSATFEKASVTAEVLDNRLVGDFDFRLENSTDHIAGKVEVAELFDFRSALQGQGSLELNDLSLLSFFVPEIDNPLGKIYGNVELGGSLASPEISGEIGLRDGSADIRRAGISVTDMGLLIRQSKAGELSLQGSARSGDGYLQIDGETTLGAETGIRSEIRLAGEDFRLVNLPDLQAIASPTINVLLDERETRVSGELRIPEASITIKSVPESSEKPSPDVVVHRGDAEIIQPRRLLTVDVATTLGENVSFAGFGLSTNLEGSVRITGSSKSPYQGLGRVVLSEGRYRAYGQNLEIESGELIFNGPLSNPALNVRASRTASDRTVAGIHLTGTPTQLNSQVYSEPPLADAEALSYLLTGRPLSGASSEEGSMLNQAAFALGLTTAGSVASRIRNQLGFETLGVQGGGDNSQLVAGRRFGDRLFVEYAYGVVDSLGTLLLRYQLSRRLVVESRSGLVRNVDVVYSVKKP